jgi:uncharacterized protein
MSGVASLPVETITFAIAAAGLFLAGIIKGATGLGYASCALPFLVVSIGLKPAMALVLAPAVATNISLVVTTGHLRETLVAFRYLYLAMLPGISVGLLLLLWVDQVAAAKALGVVILVYVLLTFLRPNYTLPKLLRGWLQLPAGFLNGIITGLTGSQVMPLLPYVMALQLDPGRTVQAINLGVIIGSAVLSIGLYMTGILTPKLAGGSLLAIAPALLGVSIGVQLRKGLSVGRFRQAVLVTLFAIGLVMLLK